MDYFKAVKALHKDTLRDHLQISSKKEDTIPTSNSSGALHLPTSSNMLISKLLTTTQMFIHSMVALLPIITRITTKEGARGTVTRTGTSKHPIILDNKMKAPTTSSSSS